MASPLEPHPFGGTAKDLVKSLVHAQRAKDGQNGQKNDKGKPKGRPTKERQSSSRT